MPYIAVNVSTPLDAAKKEEIKSELGKLIELLPGKSESVLMVELDDAKSMYFRGASKSCIFIEIRLYKESPMEAKKEFTSKVFEMLERLTGIGKDDIFLNILEFDNWGAGGFFK